jgi:hypothetical protein
MASITPVVHSTPPVRRQSGNPKTLRGNGFDTFTAAGVS